MSTDDAREQFIRSYLTEEELTRLVAEARAAHSTALATYSKFYVGACILTHEGEYITGGNIENISYTQTIHAEGCAISKAISAGKKNFKAVGVYAKSENFDAFVPPCGECRQFLAEFSNFLPIVMIHESGALMFEMLHEILPLSMVLGSTAPTTAKVASKYDDLVFKANGWVLKDIYTPTRNEMKQLLRDWKFDEIHEITQDKLRLKDGVISAKFGAGTARINYLTVQELLESFANATTGSTGKLTVVQTGDNVAKSIAHRIVATLRAHKRTVALAGASNGDGTEGDVEIHVSSKGNGEIEIKFVTGKGAAISGETVERIYQEREKLLCSTMLNEFYCYKTNRLLKE